MQYLTFWATLYVADSHCYSFNQQWTMLHLHFKLAKLCFDEYYNLCKFIYFVLCMPLPFYYFQFCDCV